MRLLTGVLIWLGAGMLSLVLARLLDRERVQANPEAFVGLALMCPPLPLFCLFVLHLIVGLLDWAESP